MRVLVTGGAGFVGGSLCQKLMQDNHEVFVIDDLSTGFTENQIGKVRYFQLSIHEMKSNFFKIYLPNQDFDVVFHLAARPRVTTSVKDPYNTTYANLISTLKMLEYIRQLEHKPRFVYFSSSSVYGGADVMPTPEDFPVNPQSPYALQKYQG